MTVGPLPGPPALHCLLSAGCLLCLDNSPLGEALASSWRFSWRPGAAGALSVALTAAASLREFYPRCLVLPFRGSDTYLAFIPQLEALSESLTHSILAPSGWCRGLLMRWALLTLSGYILSVPSAFSLRRSRWSIPSHCRPSRAVSLLMVSVFGGRSLLRRGVSPSVGFHRSPWGFAVAPPISPYTGPG